MAWAPSYVATTELAAYLRIGDLDDETQLDLAIAGASRAIDRNCKRQFGQSELQARIYTPRLHHDGRHVVDVDDVQDVTGLLVATDTAGDGTFATAVTGPTFGPVNAVAKGLPYRQVFLSAAPPRPDSVRVTALWGWTEIPETVQQACLLQASRFHARRDSPYGIAGSPEAGSELRLLAKVDPDVAVMLRDYTVRWWAV